MRTAPFLVLTASFALTGGFAACQKQKPPPSIDGLSEALERSAEKALGAPSLADEQMTVTAKPGQVEARTAEIKQDFSTAGGTGVSSVNARGEVSVFGSIPAINLAAFKALVRHEKASMQPGPESPSCMIEVLIVPAAADASPSATP
jgi:hypothetical protein